MTIRAQHWALTLIITISFHLLILVVIPADNLKSAVAEGKQGVEIDLGMIGDFGEASDTTEAVKKTIKPVSEVLEETTESAVQDILEEPAIQNTDKLVERSEPKKLIEVITVNERVNATVKEAVMEERLEPINSLEIMNTKKTEKDNLQDDKNSDKQLVTQQKKSTGEANAASSGGQAGVSRSYLAKLLAQLAQHKQYPLSSRKKAEEGIAILDFRISRTGRVLDFDIQKSSGFNALDKAVLVMLKRAEPFPPVPSDIKGKNIRFTLPIAFKLNS